MNENEENVEMSRTNKNKKTQRKYENKKILQNKW